jgi:hypothetical protein
MKTAKFGGPAPKPKTKKIVITKKEYRNMTAGRVAGSLDRLFTERKEKV